MSFSLAAIAFLGSICSILYELILSKVITFYTGDLILWQSITLGTYLAALGCGVLYQLRGAGTWRRLFYLEITVACLGALMIPVLLSLHALYRIYLNDYGETSLLWVRPLSVFAIVAQGVVGTVGFFCGQELPLIFRQFKTSASAGPFLLALTYLGALAGGILFTGVFLEHVDMSEAAVWAAYGNLFVAAIVFHGQADMSRSESLWKHLATVGAALLVFAIQWNLPNLQELGLKNFYYNRPLFSVDPTTGIHWDGPVGVTELSKFASRYKPVRRVRTQYQAIDFVTKDFIGDEYAMFLNGHYQFETGREVSYHQTMSHGPIWGFHAKPRRVLVLGGGDGLLVRDLLKLEPAIERIVIVELDAKMVREAEAPPLSVLNENAFTNPRVSVVVDDAFTWLRQSQETGFDAILADFPYPYDGESLRLYSVEFYRLVRKKLSSDGFFVADYPLETMLKSARSSQVSRTFLSAGFAQTWWLQTPGESFVVAAREKKEVYGKDLGDSAMHELYPDAPLSATLSILKPHKFMEADRFF